MSNKVILGVTICAGLLSSAASIVALSSHFAAKPEAAPLAGPTAAGSGPGQAHPARAGAGEETADAQGRNARLREQFLRSMTPEQKERWKLLSPEQRKELLKEERAKLAASAEAPAR